MKSSNNGQYMGDMSQEWPPSFPSPPLRLSVMALIALLNLFYSQVRMKPVELFRFEVFES